MGKQVSIALLVGPFVVVMIGCGGPIAPSTPQTGEAFCATIGAYFCGTTQANLQVNGLPSGYQGFCQVPASSGIGLVGYSAVTIAGGVKSASRADR